MRRILLLSLLAVAGCAKAPTAPTAPSNVFLVTAFATPQSFIAGNATTVIVGIENVSSIPQTFETNFCGPAYHVFNPAGTQLYTGLACATYSAPKTLAPGEQAVYTSQWTTVGKDAVGHSTGPLPAGTYTLRGALEGANVQSSSFTVSLVQCAVALCN